MHPFLTGAKPWGLIVTLAACLLLSVATPANRAGADASNTGTIVGFVTQIQQTCNQSTACVLAPVPNVTAFLHGTDIGATTDSTGKFTLTNVPLGYWTVQLQLQLPPYQNDAPNVANEMQCGTAPVVHITQPGQVAEIPGFIELSLCPAIFKR